MRRSILTLLLPLATALPLLLDPAQADACGGTFCDTGPMSMPVDQSGENILFVLDGNTVEAHIQIQYDPNTDAEKFAWVIPMTTVPEFEVGSQQLFTNALNGTVPTYGFNNSFEPCGDGGTSTSDSGDSTTDTSDSGGDTGTTGGPEIVLQEVVGAFEVTVLQGGTSAEVMQWLGDNGYQQDPNAEPILGEYLAEGYLFVALKLAMNTEVAEIHPIVLRYQGDESCVPLRLTRIAAVEDMDIRAFILAGGRAVPTNYRHVLVNPLKINWINFAANYKEVVSMAVDAFAAEGNAFVTEYAGTSNVVSQAGLFSDLWNAAPFALLDATPEETVNLLESQGLAECFQGQCFFTHDLLPPLIDKYLPVPNGVTPEDFYGCLLCYAGLIDDLAWDADAFAADLDERIIQPGMHAEDLLQTWPYITRMYTTISPNEMYADPIFHINGDLPEVTNIRQGNRYSFCDGGALFTLPDGREVYLPNPNVWPDFGDEMPWEEDVELAGLMGPNQVISDRTELIDQLLAAWNAQHGWPGGGTDTTGDTGTDTADTTDGTADTIGDDIGDDIGTDGDGTGGGGLNGPQASCACSSDGQGGDAPYGWGLLALAGLGLIRRRR